MWSSGGDLHLAGYSLLAWHFALGGALALAAAIHALLRGRRLRRRDVAGRRQFVQAASVATGAYALWWLQRPVAALVGLRGATRRFTGSYQASSYAGNAFPSTSWIADHPRPLSTDSYRLLVDGLLTRPLSFRLPELDVGDELVATLDCTGGFYSTQRWRGIRLGRLLELAAARPQGRK